MSLIGRYLVREILWSVAFVLLGFLALFGFFDFINELDDIGKAGYRLQHALAFVALGLPSRVYELMPIATLIGAIYAFAQFASHSEFTAMRAAGLGRRRALAMMLGLGAWLALFTALVGEVLTPPTEKLGQQVRLSALGGTVAGQFRSGLWIRDAVRREDGSLARLRFVNVTELLPDTSLSGLRVYEFDADYRLTEILEARTGRYRGEQSWTLEGVERTRFTGMTVAGDEVGLKASRESLTELLWASELNPDLLGVLMLVPERMSVWNLIQYIHHLHSNQQRADRYEIALWNKIVYPLVIVVMMALALPFAYLQVRAGGIGYKVFAGVMLGVMFHFLNGLFSHLGLLNTWPAWLSVSVPSLIALALALGLLAWVDRAR